MSGPVCRLEVPGLSPDDPVAIRQRKRLQQAFPRGGIVVQAADAGALEGAVDRRLIAEGVRRLQEGGLVAFPTETVYGLGADARSEAALERLYRVKGRPGSHPVIVHVGDVEGARACAGRFSPLAEALAQRFWPGPLTLIVEKASWVPARVTGGQDSVGVRVPSHRLALGLLAAFGGPVAAPSANRFGRVSPTTADHVAADLGEEVDVILDGGACDVGVESTILDVRGGDPVLLRPGGVPVEVIEDAVKRHVRIRGGGEPRVSGALPSHYAPRATVELVAPADLEARAGSLRASGLKVRVLTAKEVEAHDLYGSLRGADASGADVILAPLPAEAGLGRAVADRLRRAAGPRSEPTA
jgi:L-threonylcarbamoyladenylate synthase